MQPRFQLAHRLGRTAALAALCFAAFAAAPGQDRHAQAQQAPGQLGQGQPGQGQTGQGQAGQGPQPETQRFEDWTVACFPQQDGGRECRMLQNVGNGEGQIVMQAAVLTLPDGRPGLLFNLPLGVWLPEGVTLQIDGGEQIRVPYARCLPAPDQCRVELVLDQTRVDQLKAGTTVQVTFFDPRQQPVTARISLLGFTAAFNALPR